MEARRGCGREAAGAPPWADMGAGNRGRKPAARPRTRSSCARPTTRANRESDSLEGSSEDKYSNYYLEFNQKRVNQQLF